MLLIMIVLALLVSRPRDLVIGTVAYTFVVIVLNIVVQPDIDPARLMAAAGLQFLMALVVGAVTFGIKRAVVDGKKRRKRPPVLVDPGPRY